jgi:hypothetical protein
VGSLFKTARWIHFTLFWINVCHFTNHSPNYLDRNVLLYVSTLLPVSRCQSATAHSCCAQSLLDSHWSSLPLDNQLFSHSCGPVFIETVILSQATICPQFYSTGLWNVWLHSEHWPKLLEHHVSWTHCARWRSWITPSQEGWGMPQSFHGYSNETMEDKFYTQWQPMISVLGIWHSLPVTNSCTSNGYLEYTYFTFMKTTG